MGTVGIFFDPPYAVENRSSVYECDDFNVAHDVRAWAIERGDKKTYRICIAGYENLTALWLHSLRGWPNR